MFTAPFKKLVATAATVVGVLALAGIAQAQQVQLPAEDVRNTKHNFLLNTDVGYSQATSSSEICVFCHTPHGGRTDVVGGGAPLWNRALPATAGAGGAPTYTMYTSPNFDAGVAGNVPQGVSLACLSCHDGTVGIDALINAPGSGGFLSDNAAGGAGPTSMGFNTTGGPVNGITVDSKMNPAQRPDCTPGTTCVQPFTGSQLDALVGNDALTATFGMSPFPNLTQDLSDDHPISIQIPDGATDPQFNLISANFTAAFQGAGGVTYLTKFTAAELNDDVRDRVRAYPTVAGSQYVECASCHNPHTPRPLFLRLPSVNANLTTGGGATTWEQLRPGSGGGLVSHDPNFQSAICLSCHEK